MLASEHLFYDVARTQQEMKDNLKSLVWPPKNTAEQAVAQQEYEKKMGIIIQGFKNYLAAEYAIEFAQETQDLIFATASANEQDSTAKIAATYCQLAELLRQAIQIECL